MEQCCYPSAKYNRIEASKEDSVPPFWCVLPTKVIVPSNEERTFIGVQHVVVHENTSVIVGGIVHEGKGEKRE